MRRPVTLPADEVEIGDIMQGLFVAEISHGPLDWQIRFTNTDDTATAFRFEDELVTVEREVRS